MSRTTRVAACAGLLAFTASACALTQSDKNAAPSGGGKITVTSSDAACKVSKTKAPAGNLVFTIKNAGSKVTEFYLYGADGKRIVGEVENIGPGLTRQLVLRAPEGKYTTACKPGMKGAGIRAAFIVTKGAADAGRVTGVDQATIDQATSQYAAYVEDQVGLLVAKTAKFVAAYRAGDDAAARAIYPVARTHWEVVEPVAESFGDLDPKTDAREADLEPGQRWTGWHRIEKDLWPPSSGYALLTVDQRARFADDLLANVKTLRTRVEGLRYTVNQIANGSKGLLDEVASTKITGEEDIWSRTDLWDFQANVDGARVAYETLKPLLRVKDPALSTRIGRQFDALQKDLDTYKKGTGFVSYDTVTEPQRRRLSDRVNALSEPLSKMAGAVTL